MLSALRAKPLDSIRPHAAALKPAWARTSIWPLLILLSWFAATDAFATAQGISSAYAVDVNVTLLGQPNTQEGPLPTSNSAGSTTGTLASSTAPGILTTGVLNTSATASGGDDTATASASNVKVLLLSTLGTVSATTIQASCNATASGISGNTTLTNATLGSLGALATNPAPGTTISITYPVIGQVATLILNEQISNADGSETFNAWHLHLTGGGGVGTLGTGDVIVGSVTCGAALLPPTVTAVSPAAGTSIGGTTVTITGTGFTGATAVMFGATGATSFNVNTDNSITATAPSGTGTVDVTVTTPAGTSIANPADQYTYVVLLAPTATAAFSPPAIDLGQTSQLTITVTNPNAIALTSVQFSDILPSGLTLLTETAGTCGTVATGGGNVNINTGSGSFSVMQNTLAANSSCNVTFSVRGNLPLLAVDNTTSISSSNASAGGAATATLTVNSAVTATQIIPSETLTYSTTAVNFTPVTGGGGTGALTYGIAPLLPTGLTLDPATGAISGTPGTTSAAKLYTVRVTDTVNASASNTFTLTVAQAMPVLNWTAPAAITYGTALGSTQLNATASFNSNPVAGTFAYTPAAGTLLGAGPNQALSTTFTPTDAIDYAAAAASTTITVNAAATATTLVSNPSATVYGEGTTLSATVSLPVGNSGTVVGAVAFNEGASALPGCGAVPVSSGSAQCSIASLPVGSHAIVAVYTPSNSNTIASTGSAANVTVTKGATTTAITTPAVITLGNPVNVTASVSVTSPGAGTPTGTITISDGGSAAGDTCVILLPATSCMLTPSSGGVKTLSAIYSGDAGFAGSAAPPSTSLTVNPAQAGTSVTSSINPSTFGQSVTFTATVTPTAGNPTPTGVVNFTDTTTNSSLCANATLVAGSGDATASCAASTLAVGVHNIQAAYGGDTNNQSSSATLTQTVNKDTATMTLTASPNVAGVGQNVTLTATVFGDPPTGSVTFYDGTSQLGTGVLATTSSTSSVATFATSTLAPGTHNVSATYAGDGNNQATASAVVAVTVTVTTAPVTAPMLDRWALLLLIGMICAGALLRWCRETKRI